MYTVVVVVVIAVVVIVPNFGFLRNYKIKIVKYVCCPSGKATSDRKQINCLRFLFW